MKQYRYLTQILILTILAFFLVTCDNTPIFFSLEKAYKTSDDRGLEDDIVIEKIVWTGSEYFVHGQSVYKRAQGTSSTWQEVPPPAGGAACGGLEYFGTEIFAWFYDSKDLEPVGLYSRVPGDPASDPWTGPITDTDWDVPIGNWPDEQFRVYFVKAAGTQLFVSTSVYDDNAGTTSYTLYYSGNGAPDSFTASGGVSTDSQIVDVEWDGSSYWAITTPGVSVGDNPTFLYEDVGGVPDAFLDRSQDAGVPAFWKNGSDDPLGTSYTADSLYYASTAGELYLSGWHGRIFIHDVGGWSDFTDRKTVEVGNEDRTVEFTAFVENTNESQIFVGSIRYGFFYFSDGYTSATSLVPSNIVAADSPYEYFPNELKNGGIRNFLVDTEDPPDNTIGDIMFACTAGAGLWRGDWDGVKWIWKQE